MCGILEWIPHIPTDWEAILFGGQTLGGESARINDHTYTPGYAILAHCYAVRGAGLQRAYHALVTAPERGPEIDHRLAALWDSGEIVAYAPYEWIVHQSAGFSDIREENRPERGAGSAPEQSKRKRKRSK